MAIFIPYRANPVCASIWKYFFVETMHYAVPQGSVLVHYYSFCTQLKLTWLWNNMGYHCIFMQTTFNSNSTADPMTTISPKNRACLHIWYWSVDAIQSSSSQPVKDRVSVVCYLMMHPPDRRRFFPFSAMSLWNRRSLSETSMWRWKVTYRWQLKIVGQCLMLPSPLSQAWSALEFTTAILSLQAYRIVWSIVSSVLHAAGRIVAGVRLYDHIIPTLRDELHWLPVTQCITFKLCLTVYKALHGTTPYIAEFCRPLAATHYQ